MHAVDSQGSQIGQIRVRGASVDSLSSSEINELPPTESTNTNGNHVALPRSSTLSAVSSSSSTSPFTSNLEGQGQHKSIRYEYTLQDEKDESTIEVQLTVPVEGEELIISFEFDIKNDTPEEEAANLCEHYKVPDQEKSVLATLKKLLSDFKENQAVDAALDQDPEAQARLEKQLKDAVKYEEGRLKRLQESKMEKEKEEERRRRKYDEELKELEKKMRKERESMEQKQEHIRQKWRDQEVERRREAARTKAAADIGEASTQQAAAAADNSAGIATVDRSGSPNEVSLQTQ